MTNLDRVQEAVDVLYGRHIADATFLASEFEELHRAFAYNYILAGDDAIMTNKDACNALSNLEMLIDGLRGKNIRD